MGNPCPSPWKWPRDAWFILIGVVVGVWLLMQWQLAAAEWGQRGCKHPYVVALLRGEPEWYEVCLNDTRQ